MTHPNPRDENGNPTSSDANSGRGTMAPFVLTVIAAIALIGVLSPRAREVHDGPVTYATEATAPGPIPSTERRPDAAL